MRSLFSLAVIVLFCLPVAARAQESRPRLEFKGLAPDENVRKIVSGKGWRCIATKTAGADEMCYDSFQTIAGVQAQTTVVLKDSKAIYISVIFDEENYQRVVNALEEKYGSPDKKEMTIVTNKLGTRFDNETKTWASGDSIMRAKQRGNKITESNLSITGRVFFELSKKDDEEQKIKDVGDL